MDVRSTTHRIVCVLLLEADEVLLHQKLLDDDVIQARQWARVGLQESCLRIADWGRVETCTQKG